MLLTVCCTRDTQKKKVVLSPEKTEPTQIDTLVAKEELKTTPIQKKSKTEKKPIPHAPSSTEKFFVNDLSLTWEEINSCDCLFAIAIKNTSYKKLYFGRFKGDSSAILQLGKKNVKQILPIINSRDKKRKPGSLWKETYQNPTCKIDIKAKPVTNKVNGKFTYRLDFNFTDLTNNQSIKKVILTNCKS